MLPGETELNIRVLVDRAIVEAFVMKGQWTVDCPVCWDTAELSKPLLCQGRHGDIPHERLAFGAATFIFAPLRSIRETCHA